jgi:hypothetical protein
MLAVLYIIQNFKPLHISMLAVPYIIQNF